MVITLNKKWEWITDMLLGFEFTRTDREKGEKVFVPLDKIVSVTKTYKRDLITNKKLKPQGALVQLTNRTDMLVKENYEDILEKWLDSTQKYDKIDVLDSSQ